MGARAAKGPESVLAGDDDLRDRLRQRHELRNLFREPDGNVFRDKQKQQGLEHHRHDVGKRDARRDRLFKGARGKIEAHRDEEAKQQQENPREKAGEQVFAVPFFRLGKALLVGLHRDVLLVLEIALVLFLGEPGGCHRAGKVGKRDRARICGLVAFLVSRSARFSGVVFFKLRKLAGKPCREILQELLAGGVFLAVRAAVVQRDSENRALACIVVAQVNHQLYLAGSLFAAALGDKLVDVAFVGGAGVGAFDIGGKRRQGFSCGVDIVFHDKFQQRAHLEGVVYLGLGRKVDVGDDANSQHEADQPVDHVDFLM